LPRIAQDALEAGYDSRALRMLAGLEKPTVWDAEPLWYKALDEIGTRKVVKAEALMTVADWVIAKYEAGELQIRNAASILCRMYSQNDYDNRLIDIYMVEEYVAIGLINESELAEAFRRFKQRDFSQREPLSQQVSNPSFASRLKRLLRKR